VGAPPGAADDVRTALTVSAAPAAPSSAARRRAGRVPRGGAGGRSPGDHRAITAAPAARCGWPSARIGGPGGPHDRPIR